MKRILKKLISSILLVIVLMNAFGGIISNAVEMTRADLVTVGNAEYHLKYYREDTESYRDIVCTIVGHFIGSIFYPAYCMNKDLNGVTSDYSYSVNVKELSNRDDIWRIVKNGFPYKTGAQMGLTSDFDAYAVTKFAIYCVLGQSDINKFYADPNDAEGVAMLNCLKNLVDIGVNGTEPRTQGNFSIEKDGAFIEDGEYYSQVFEVNSNVEMSNYDIVSLNNFPDGSVANKIDDSHFKIYVPKSKLNSNIEGSIDLKGHCKTYPIFYGESEKAEDQDYVLTYDFFGEVSSKCGISIYTNTGSLNIKKVAKETNKPLAGVKFGLYKDNKLISEKTTDSNGNAQFQNLFQGEYFVKELETISNYILNTEAQKVKIEYNKKAELQVSNEYKKGNIKVLKIDKDDKTHLSDIQFELYNSNGNLVGKYTTDKNGEIKINNLNIGKYIIKEVKSKTGYELINNVEVNVNWNETTELELTNEKSKGRIKVIKVDKDNKETKIAGVKFGIFDNNKNLIETIVTDKNGEAISSKLPVYNNVYFVKEMETLNEYVLSEEEMKVELKANEIKNLVFENELKKGSLELVKLDKDTKTPISNVEFELYSSENKLLNKFVTDENGKIFISNLKEQKDYYLKEVKTSDIYNLSKDNIKFDIKYNETTKLEVFNEKIKSKIKIIKVDKDNKEIKIPDVEFGIYNSKNELIEKIITNKDGEAYSSNLPIKEEYSIKELKTGEKYQLSNDIIKIVLKENEISTIKFENELKPGKLEILKTDKDTKEPIEGVSFDLYSFNKTFIKNYVTDKDGKIYIDNLKPGKNYYVIEKQTDKRYELIKTPTYFDINCDEITKLEIKNEKIKGRLKITKVDKDDNNIKLNGVQFEIYDDKSKLLETLTTDNDGTAYSSLLPCVDKTYTVVESKTLPGYIRNNEFTFFKLSKDKDYELVITNEKQPKPISVVTEEVPKVLPRTGY